MSSKFEFFLHKLIAVMCIVAVVLCFGACANDSTEETQPSQTVEGTSAETVETTAETTATENSFTLYSDYVPHKAYNEDGEEINIDNVYGSSYHDYGGTLNFADDGTFTTYIGAFANTDAESGTYKFLSDTEIEMTLNNGEVQIATIVSSENGAVTELQYSHRGFDVLFVAQ